MALNGRLEGLKVRYSKYERLHDRLFKGDDEKALEIMMDALVDYASIVDKYIYDTCPVKKDADREMRSDEAEEEFLYLIVFRNYLVRRWKEKDRDMSVIDQDNLFTFKRITRILSEQTWQMIKNKRYHIKQHLDVVRDIEYTRYSA